MLTLSGQPDLNAQRCDLEEYKEWLESNLRDMTPDEQWSNLQRLADLCSEYMDRLGNAKSGSIAYREELLDQAYALRITAIGWMEKICTDHPILGNMDPFALEKWCSDFMQFLMDIDYEGEMEKSQREERISIFSNLIVFCQTSKKNISTHTRFTVIHTRIMNLLDRMQNILGRKIESLSMLRSAKP